MNQVFKEAYVGENPVRQGFSRLLVFEFNPYFTGFLC